MPTRFYLDSLDGGPNRQDTDFEKIIKYEHNCVFTRAAPKSRQGTSRVRHTELPQAQIDGSDRRCSAATVFHRRRPQPDESSLKPEGG